MPVTQAEIDLFIFFTGGRIAPMLRSAQAAQLGSAEEVPDVGGDERYRTARLTA